jgi:mercuric ion transport protein
VKYQTLLKTGIIGSVLAPLCCFTPILLILLTALGLSAWAGKLDHVLMPVFVVSVGITIYALYRRHKESACCSGNREQNQTREKK